MSGGTGGSRANRAVVLMRRDYRRSGRASPSEAISAAYSAACWAIILPAVVLHEMSHVVAALAVGSEFKGVGARVEFVGSLGPIPIYRVRSFFVLHDVIGNRYVDALVSLAPAGFLLLWQLSATVGAPFIVQAVFAAIGFSVVSDVLVMVLSAMDRGDAPGMDDARPVFLIGGPDQWQTDLDMYGGGHE